MKHANEASSALRHALDEVISSSDADASAFRNGPVTVVVVRGEHAACLNRWYEEHFTEPAGEKGASS